MDIKVLSSQQIDMIENIQSQYDKLYYIGNLDLLKKRKISIVGSRHPNSYSKQMISKLASKLSEVGICIVSGGAMGIDAIAHKAAKYNNTIMVAGTGLDKQYPAINKNMINQIETNGLILSQFTQGTPSLPRNFAIRNKLIVMLSDILIIYAFPPILGGMFTIYAAVPLYVLIDVFSNHEQNSLNLFLHLPTL
jgi:DNA processing protein